MAHDFGWILQMGDRVFQLIGQAGDASEPSCNGASCLQALTDGNEITRSAPAQ